MQPTSRPFIGSKVPAADRDRSSRVFICNSLAGSHESGSGTSAWFEFDDAAYCQEVGLRSLVRVYSLGGSASIGSGTVALRSAQRWTIKYIAGKTNNMRIADVTIPPTTTRANGFWVSEPMPVATDAGSKPIAAASAAINTGRSCNSEPLATASRKEYPPSRNC